MSNRRKPKGEKKPSYDIEGTIALGHQGKVVVKTVPAKVNDIVVGVAELYEDGTTGVIFNDDIPPEAKRIMQDEYNHYSLGG